MVSLAPTRSAQLPSSSPVLASTSPPPSSTVSAVDHSLPPPRPRSTVRPHYRPFSTLYTDSPLPPQKSRRNSFIRPNSILGFPSIPNMGFKFKDKTKEKEISRPKALRPVDSNPGLRPASPVRTRSTPAHISREEPAAERSGASQSRFNALRKGLAKKRSLASLLTSEPVLPPSPLSLHSSQASGSSPNLTQPLASNSSPDLTEHAAVSSASRIKEEDEDAESDYETPTDRYIGKDIWARRQGMQLHPFGSDAPYMQAYNPILLENDRLSDTLMRRLNPNGTPSFHDYGRNPPASVLDLGCGQGHWISFAARSWTQSQITGFDLVNVVLPNVKKLPNVRFVQGNFLKAALPFTSNSFELVRMANLALCIPYENWQNLLAEVQRILSIGGRLELIDDQIFFPYGKLQQSRSAPASPPAPSRSLSSFDFDDDDDLDDDGDGDTLEDEESSSEEFLDSSSTLYSSEAGDLTPEKLKRGSGSTDVSPILVSSGSPTKPDTPNSINTTHTTTTTIRPSVWASDAAASKELESVFEAMLNKQFSLHPRPSEFLLDLLKSAFGKPQSKQLHCFHLKLAPAELPVAEQSLEHSSESKSGSSQGHGSNVEFASQASGGQVRKPWISVEWEKKERKPVQKGKRNSGGSTKRSSADFQLPEGMSAKAADRLGISYSALAAATTPTRPESSTSSFSSVSSTTSQSPGLIVWPSTFIPLSPTELEMHACKHVHTLLGCKVALSDFISGFTAEDGTSLVSEEEFTESIWQYECFRRQRFNWPSQAPEYDLDPQIQATAITSGMTSNSSVPRQSPSSPSDVLQSNHKDLSNSYDRDELTHIRTLRVYEAVKTSGGALTSRSFPRRQPPPSMTGPI